MAGVESVMSEPSGSERVNRPRNEPLRDGNGLDPLTDLLHWLDDDSLWAAAGVIRLAFVGVALLGCFCATLPKRLQPVTP